MNANHLWGQDGPEEQRPDWTDAVIDRLQRRLDDCDDPTDREVLAVKIMGLLQKQQLAEEAA